MERMCIFILFIREKPPFYKEVFIELMEYKDVHGIRSDAEVIFSFGDK